MVGGMSLSRPDDAQSGNIVLRDSISLSVVVCVNGEVSLTQKAA